MTDPAADLLATAAMVLDGVGHHRARSACWLSRSALELVVDGLLRVRDIDVGDASMRSRLTCLQIEYLDEPAVSDVADYAWSRLSDACHYHAYELSPTDAEARELVLMVSELAGR